ncbi:glycosyltransferase [Antarcticibacterium flavum]|uniref:Glycosyltransferase n=2 Tax=Antarcticibacterium TaxID=2058174 RepID=A0A5B7X1H4_9FLAO|nr:glycosyltransferase family 2 protein [Antarcticibacterium flavum]QCY69159.1 glycosyltransferase [Antarcticibacterium flavum]
MWYNYSNISVPEKPDHTPNLSVDILTTYFPGEPYQMTITTLEAIKNIEYPHTTFLCDEANDPFLKEFCIQNDIIHVTRSNRINAKAGNINNALENYATGDICVILDPDHIPEPHFLDPILPHFANEQIAFVQIVQSYYNIKETLVARGAAEQTFQFYGPMMMTLNAYGTVNAIGANCVFRRKALDSIGGHAPGLCEDMHTAMLLYAKGWKAVYVPEILARGLAPSNITNFFKQQIKWSRGTFDLLLKVYPKIFHKLTARQKIHFGILPLHYLGGLITFINFLIPILSLLFSTIPWKGNIVDFAIVIAPVAASSILIRTFVQKWVIEKRERGFHILGGLLHINTWWIYLVGLGYTILNKKVPYLPTPKENEWNSNYKIVIPNIIIALLSLFAIGYGLQRDFTPYSILMAGFAFFNACIMFFGVYLSNKVTNQNRLLRSHLKPSGIRNLYSLKQNSFKAANVIFNLTRRLALPLLLLLLISSMTFKERNDKARWEKIPVTYQKDSKPSFLGIYQPKEETALPDISEINLMENLLNKNFNIISLYLGWENNSQVNFPHSEIRTIYEKNAIPLITWEPWTNDSLVVDGEAFPGREKSLKKIADGHYDSYILDFLKILKSYDKPVFLRFAHEFDNPGYPWSHINNNTPEDFKKAWRHLHELIHQLQADNIMTVWNPWKPEAIEDYFPGDNYIDWVGLTILNYSSLNEDGNTHSFDELYQPFKDKLFLLTKKPVMIAEFGSLKLQGNQKEWVENSISTIENKHPEIRSIVFFNSHIDQNIPDNQFYPYSFLDWSLKSNLDLLNRIETAPTYFEVNPGTGKKDLYPLNFDYKGIYGVHYKKGKEWKDNYYALTRKTIVNDFQLMQEAGINTIKYTGSSIYDYNVNNIAADFGINLFFNFPADHWQTIEGNDRKDFLERIEKLKDQKQIKNYIFELEGRDSKPGLNLLEKNIHLRSLKSLLSLIREIDPSKEISLEIPLNHNTIKELNYLKQILPVNSYGLRIENIDYLQEVISFAEEAGINLYIADLDPRNFIKNQDLYKFLPLIFNNWQDERQSTYLTFDGLLNFNGDKKEDFELISRFNNYTEKLDTLQRFKILRPAIPLISGNNYPYRAVFFTGNNWIITPESLPMTLSWYLIKKDFFGNPLALKKLGLGKTIEVIIPEDYKNYELMLIIKDNNDKIVRSATSPLHTPDASMAEVTLE